MIGVYDKFSAFVVGMIAVIFLLYPTAWPRIVHAVQTTDVTALYAKPAPEQKAAGIDELVRFARTLPELVKQAHNTQHRKGADRHER